MNIIHVCSFTGAVGMLSRKDKNDPLVILRTLSECPYVSDWDMVGNLLTNIDALIKLGLVKWVKEPQPWSRYEVTEAGKSLLAAKGEE